MIDWSRQIAIRWQKPTAGDAALIARAGLVALDDAAIKAMNLPPEGASGQWPGITRPATVTDRGDFTSSASREPWVDANGYRAAWLRAVHPTKPSVLHYLPELGDRAVPFDTLELALIEAWVNGGNYLLALEPSYKQALQGGDAKAMAAWDQLGRTARWLRENAPLFRQPATPIVTALVDEGDESAEIANLLFRRNVSPRLATQPVSGATVLVAANLKQPPGTGALKFAISGGTLITTPLPSRPAEAKLARTDSDRVLYKLGKGMLVEYKDAIADPSEFALDVIDFVTHPRRPVRLWNASAVIPLLTGNVLHLVNYGSPIDIDTQVRVQGHFSHATLLRPDGDALPLKTARRGSTTEIQLPELRRLAVVQFS